MVSQAPPCPLITFCSQTCNRQPLESRQASRQGDDAHSLQAVASDSVGAVLNEAVDLCASLAIQHAADLLLLHLTDVRRLISATGGFRASLHLLLQAEANHHVTSEQ